MRPLVVCISTDWTLRRGGPIPLGDHPIKGEIYEVVQISENNGVHFYDLRGFDLCRYDTQSFRPVDDTFGPNICEIVEKQIELETV